MREVQASEAKTHFTQLLDAVEGGESVVITRHGRPVARITPERPRRREDVEKAIANIRAIAKKNGPITVDEILSARDEGRK